MRNKSILLSTASLVAAPAILSGAYANTLTGLIGQLYEGVDVVSREMVGFIPSVTRNVNAERAAVGQNVTYPLTQAAGLVDIVPAMVPPTPGDVTLDSGNIVITKSKAARFGLTGEETKGLNNGVGALSAQASLFAEALRTIVNAIEGDLALEAALNASRAWGTAGTTPFSGGVGDSAQVAKILTDNGTPAYGRSLIVDTTAGAALRTLTQLSKANEAGTSMTLRDGELLSLNGLSLKESAGIVTQGSGTGAGATTNAAGYAVGATDITLAAAGTGTIIQGGIITFAGDTNKYTVISGEGNTADGGVIKIAKPGLRRAIPAVATAITLVGVSTRNIGFSQNALHLVARAPALPTTGDSAVERMMIYDERSGMAFEISLYAGYKMMMAEVGCAWGVKAVKPEHIAALLG